MGAQTRESQMLEMTSWMSEMSQLLQQRLDADILAGDVPPEYEVSRAGFFKTVWRLSCIFSNEKFIVNFNRAIGRFYI